MPRIVLASTLARWCSAAPSCPSEQLALNLPGETVREVLEHLFAEYPSLRGYVLDERQGLRHHVMIVVGNQVVYDKQRLADPVPPDGEVYVLQALSGG